MSDLNSVIIIGRLGRDAEPPQGNGPARFSVAVNSSRKQGDDYIEEANWIDVTYWHRSILPYLTKGARIAIRGELRQERWTDRNTNEPRSKLVVLAQEIQLLGSREEGQGRVESGSGGKTYGAGAGGAAAGQGAASAARRDHDRQGPPDDFTDDIPF